MRAGFGALGAMLLAGSAYAQVAAPPSPAVPARPAMPTCTPSPGEPVECRAPNAADQMPAFPQQTRAPYAPSNVALNVETVAENLALPWGMALFPDRRFLVPEKAGTVRILSNGTRCAPVDRPRAR